MATEWKNLPNTSTPITAENLIKDQTAVQVTQPIGGQGVWIKDSKNLFDGITESGAYNSSGVKTTDNTMTRTANKIPVKSSTSYIWSNNGAGVPMNVFEYDRNGAFISSQTGITANSSFTTTSTTYFITAYKGNANTDKLQLEYGSTIHAYESYIENPTINTNINGQYKEIYNKDNMGKLVVEKISGKNLFDETTVTNITISATGAIASNNSYKTSDYITIIPSQSYYFSTTQRSGQTTKQIYLAYYDSSKTFISRDNYNLYENSFITPSNAKYVRAGYYSDGQEKPQLELGTQATSYVPFNRYSYNSEESMGNIVVDDILPTNLIPFEAVTTTSNGVTFTANADKTVKINGTATAQTDFTIGNVSLKAGQQYYLSGAKGGSANTWFLNIQGVGNDNGSGFIYTPAQDETKRIFIRVKNGVTVNNAKCTPKLNKGSSDRPFDATAYVLWQNPSPTSNFAGQQITLNDSLVNYKYYEIISFYDINNSLVITSGKIPYNKQAFLNVASFKNCRRLITANGLTTLTFGDGQTYNTYNSTTATTTNDNLIPYQVIAYK